MSREFAKLLAPLSRRLRLMASRCVLTLISDIPGVQIVQVKLLDGEVRAGVERMQQYGFTSVPLPGAEGVFLSLGADRDHGIVIASEDRRHRIKGLQGGEVAVYTDEGDSIVFKRGGVIEITAATKVRMITPLLEVTGEIKDRCDSGGRTMAGMRDIYNAHTHSDPQGGSVSTPTGEM